MVTPEEGKALSPSAGGLLPRDGVVHDQHVVGTDHRNPVASDRWRPLFFAFLGWAEAGVADNSVAHEPPRPGGIVGELLARFGVGLGAVGAGIQDQRADAVPGQRVVPGRADAGVAEKSPNAQPVEVLWATLAPALSVSPM